jgi:hypothetical protein
MEELMDWSWLGMEQAGIRRIAVGIWGLIRDIYPGIILYKSYETHAHV